MKAWVRRKDLPKKCWYACDFCYDTLYCLAEEGDNVVRCSDDKRPDNCPLGIIEDVYNEGYCDGVEYGEKNPPIRPNY